MLLVLYDITAAAPRAYKLGSASRCDHLHVIDLECGRARRARAARRTAGAARRRSAARFHRAGNFDLVADVRAEFAGLCFEFVTRGDWRRGTARARAAGS